MFPGSSSSCMEAEVVEIAPPMSRSSKSKSKLQSQSLKQKEVYCPEIIDIDMDDDSDDIMLIPGEADTNGKGKEALSIVSTGPSNKTYHVSEDAIIFSEETHAEGSHNLVDVDDFDSDMDMFYDDLLNDDRYSMLQSHFDQLDIPSGVEVPIPWLMDEEWTKSKFSIASTSTHSASDTQPDLSGSSPWIEASISLPLGFEQSNHKPGSGGSLTVRDQLEGSDHPQKLKPSSKWSYGERSEAKKKFLAYRRSKLSKDALNFPNLSPKMESLKSLHLHESPLSKRKPQNWYNVAESGLPKQFPAGADHVPKFVKPIGNSGLYDVGLNVGVTGNVVKTNFALPTVDPNTYGNSAIGINFPSGYFDPSWNIPAISEEEMPFGSWMPIETQKVSSFTGSSSNSSCATQIEYGNPNEVLKRYDLFKKFDTVQDYSGHYYAQNGSPVKQPSKGWAKRIQDEWRILEKDLPETIFVRVYESRMDLLRAVIIGAEGTPYHDGLFFFDVFFPGNYPNVPPLVHYHSGGLRINPNLYNCGKVCLSLLNTWSGSQKEKWIPGVSTTLQVLVSIQGLILNAKPFFNEPGYANMSGTPKGEKSSLQYNENTFILSLKTMVYTIRRPPKYFEDFVAGHFLKRAHDILVACKAYSDGAQVGCLVKGGVQDVDEGDKSCSQHFKDGLAGYMKTVVDAFTQVGAKDCDKFLNLIQKTSQQPLPSPPIYFPEYIYPDYNYY